MRVFISFLSLLLTQVCFAGGWGVYKQAADIDTYDAGSGIYIRSISRIVEQTGFISKSEKAYIIDLFLYNPETKQGRKVFNDDKLRSISLVLFEQYFQADMSAIVFGGRYIASNVLNNVEINNREISNRLLLQIDAMSDDDLSELWVVDKDGKNLQKLVSLKDGQEWHLDVNNATLRVIEEKNETILINNHDWI